VKRFLALVLLIAVALVPASTVDAAKKKKKEDKAKTFPSTIVINTVDATGVVGGTVDSNEDKCVADRLVFVDVNDENAASVHADENGDWQADTGESFEDGDTIVARVEKMNLRKGKKGKKSDSCGPASDELVVDNATPPPGPGGEACSVPASVPEPVRAILCTIEALLT
jgi:hypothetical protein